MSPQRLHWRDIAITAYGPTILIAIGQGAILPLVALSARALGASVGTAAFIVALIGLGQLLGDLPAGALAARIGEKRALIAACVLDAVALLGAFLAQSVVLLAIAIAVTGFAGAIFNLARHAYLTDAIPVPMRARALSTLGGTFRIGLFIGPFIAAVIVTRWSIAAAYAFAAAMSLAAAILTAFLPDVTPKTTARNSAGRRHRSVMAVLAEHRHILLTLGLGILVISAARATRQSIVPLWAESIGVNAATTSVIFGISAAVDMLLFYPGGAIMDRFGRVYVAVPSMIVLGLGFLLLPLTSAATTVGLVAALMGLGNGISAGVVLTLGADASPSQDRAQFLAGWRLCSDLGNAAGPLVISAASALASLTLAAVTMGLITWAGSAWLIKWVPAYAPPLHRRQRREAQEA
ncbi:MAG TPA: MFS transporter [Propionibacteriaceae bacterium]|nr:MFS transporter [Propionibacteriaceae bacterium]